MTFKNEEGQTIKAYSGITSSCMTVTRKGCAQATNNALNSGLVCVFFPFLIQMSHQMGDYFSCHKMLGHRT